MAANFPTELQQKMNEAGFTFNIGSTTIRSNVDVGTAKVRRRYTKSIDTQALTIDMVYSDYVILYNFYDTTLNGGANTFLYSDPFTGTEEEYRFTSPPSLAPKGGLQFIVTMAWEKMP